MSGVIQANGLTRRFGKKLAVADLDFEVPEGSVYAFLGRNGAGKTTTIHLLLNLIEPTRGRAVVLGRESTRLGPAELSKIGYVSENQRLPGWMTVAELLAYVRPLYPTWDTDLCGVLAARFGLPPGGRLRDLSRGMRMKAALLVSLAYRPRL